MSAAVNRLAEKIQCKLLTYNPMGPTKDRPGPQRHLFPTGSYALGLWQTGDDIHLVCLTDNSSTTFWEYIAERLDREDLPKSDCIVTRSGDHETIWLHYCSIPPHFDLATVGAYGFPKYPSVYIPKIIRDNLARLQDTWHLLNGLRDDIEAFRDAYNVLRPWAMTAGIFSKAFGTLDPESLVWMLFNAKFKPVENNRADTSACISKDSIRAFIARYQTPQSLHNILTPSHRKPYSPPTHSVVNAHPAVARQINQLAHQPNLIIEGSAEDYYKLFCSTFENKIIVAAECWAPKQREKLHKQVVSQISLLAERLRHLDDISFVRIWPHPFRPSTDEWNYVVGIEQSADCNQQVWPKVVKSLELDIDTTIGAAAIRECSAQEASSLPTSLRTADTQPLGVNMPSVPVPKAVPTSNAKFPPASQVLSRLRWDPAHTPFDYEVGYLDRFEGLMWLPLEQWGKETEDEDFIPEHRIRIFRRVASEAGGMVVWDREKRLCELDG